MGAEEKKLLRTLAEAVSVLPAEGRKYILGYAEGVLAAADRSGAERAARDSA